MDLKEKIKQIKKKYGEMVVELDGEQITLKPTVEFYEGFIVATSNEETAVKDGTEYFIKEFPKIVAKDLNISLEEAKWLVLDNADKFVNAFLEAIGKKKI